MRLQDHIVLRFHSRQTLHQQRNQRVQTFFRGHGADSANGSAAGKFPLSTRNPTPHMTKTDLRDPADLRPHSILHHIPAPAKDSAEVRACADTIAEQDGHVLPLVIDETGHLLTDDSRLRWMAAKRMGLTEVPVVIQPAALAPVIALNAVIHRAHFTKSAIAYLAVPLLKPAFEAARSARLESLKKGQNPVVRSADYGKTWEELAEKIGVSRMILGAALQVHAEFEKDKKKYPFTIDGGDQDGATVHQTLREHFEPKILRHQQGDEHEGTRPIGLGGVMKAIGSIRSTKGVPKTNGTQLDLFIGTFATGAKRLHYWNDLEPREKSAALESVLRWVEEMPEDLKEEVVSALMKKGNS